MNVLLGELEVFCAQQRCARRIGLVSPGWFAVAILSALAAMGDGRVRGEEAPALVETPIEETDREHWSFRELVRPAVPAVRDAAWCRTPIDLFIQEKLEAKELVPQPQPGRETLLRRLHFDLLGLPPSPDELRAFVEDPREDAYERLVDRLLGSPHFGERCAQPWLDLARFAETDGYEHDKIRKEAWRYRDWVIRAFNDDLPYDRFVGLQLAADELQPDDAESLVATAFCLSGPDMPDINSQEERRHTLLNEMASTVGSVFLGLQFGCAQCHDHKYDPLSIADFYRLRAIFEPAVQLKKNESVSVLRERAAKADPSYVMLRGDWQRRGPAIEPAFPRIVNVANTRIEPSSQVAKSSGRRAALARWLTQSNHPLTARVMANRVWQHHFGYGLSQTPSDFGTIGDEPTHPELLDWLAAELVDHNWSLKHLHRLIVLSATYRQASRPSDSEWDEATAKQARAAWELAVEKDPANLRCSRFPRQRLSGEAIRDAMLAASGVMDSSMGGPGVFPPLPAEVTKVLLKGQWSVSKRPADHFRRSIYVFARRNLRYPIFEAFDRPDGNASCARRSESTTAPQSLLLLNSELSLDLARRLAGRIVAEAGPSPDAQVELAIRYVLNRTPEESEKSELVEFLRQQLSLMNAESRPTDELATPLPLLPETRSREAAAVVDLCLVLFNASEFVYVD